jgi:hypothetical protein
MATQDTTMRCACGEVAFAVTGGPILAAVCYCDDCQAGGRQIEALPGAVAVLGADGGTPCLLYRKDRLTCLSGAEHLKGYRLKADSPTERVVATCCNTGLYLNFGKGHWFTVYRDRVPGENAPMEMRICTRFAPGAVPDDLPSGATYPFAFVRKLMGARLAMLIGR